MREIELDLDDGRRLHVYDTAEDDREGRLPVF